MDKAKKGKKGEVYISLQKSLMVVARTFWQNRRKYVVVDVPKRYPDLIGERSMSKHPIRPSKHLAPAVGTKHCGCGVSWHVAVATVLK